MVAVENHPSSNREYRSITLKNGLRVLLVQDEDVDLSAASMLVEGGIFSDSKTCFGVNHLLEHMIFLGSKRFPGPSEFSKFISLNGGEENASTEMEYSLFKMSVCNKAFRKALKMFSMFFHSPLFNIESIKGEITAIENEFQLKRLNDFLRLENIKGHTAHKCHLFHRFGWGNRDSLSHHKPLKLQQLLFKLFEELFVGGSMLLVVCGNESLEDLEKLVIKYFSPIKHGPKLNRTCNDNLQVPIWSSGRLVRCNSVEGRDVLELVWRIPPKAVCRYKPEIYLMRTLEHHGPGSLYSLFRERGWLISLKVSTGDEDIDGGAYDSTSFGRLFTMRLELSESGARNVNLIVEFVCGFLQFLRGIHAPHVMEEYQRLQNFRYGSFDINGFGSNIYELVEWLAVNMHYYPIAKTISGAFDVDVGAVSVFLIKRLLSFFSVSNMRLYVVSKSFIKDSDTLTDPWFKILYKEETFPSFWKPIWSKIRKPYPGFRLPEVNQYLPFHLTPPGEAEQDGDSSEEEDREHVDSLGENIEDEDSSEEEDREHVDSSGENIEDGDSSEGDGDCSDKDICHRISPSTTLVHQYSTGPATFNFSVMFNIKPDIESQACGILFEYLLKKALESVQYKALQAGFETSVIFDTDKYLFSVIGFKETISLVVEDIWNCFISFSPSSETFKEQKEAYITDFKTSAIDVQKFAIMLAEQNLLKESFGFQSTLDTLKKIKREDLTTLITSLRSKMCINVISYGEITLANAKTMSELLIADKPLQGKSSYGVIPIENHLALDDFAFSTAEPNSLVQVIYQIGSTPNAEDSSYLNVFCEMIREHTFSVLRIKQQLGYSVSSRVQCFGGVDHFVFEVISSEVPSSILKKKVLSYARSLKSYLKSISPSQFQEYKKVASDRLSSGGESSWDEIVEKRGKHFFDNVDDHIQVMSHVNLMKFYDDNIRHSSRRIVLSISPRTSDDRPSKRPRLV